MPSLPFPISPFSSHKKLTLMSSSNPTIVLVHGGMHDDYYLAPLLASLNARFYPTVSGPLPTVSSPTPKSVELSTDVDHIRSILIKPLLNEGKDVVIAMHSYGSIVGGSAVQGLSTTGRAREGKKGGVLGLVWPVGLVLPVVVLPIDGLGGSWDGTPHFFLFEFLELWVKMCLLTVVLLGRQKL